MSYWSTHLLADDVDFTARVTSCAASEGVTNPNWAYDNRYFVASAPGFGDAYASALVNEIPNPGQDESVISDAQILSQVQALVAT